MSHPEYVDIAGEADWDTPGFRMRSCDARDQVACSAAANGWAHFERPTPLAFARAVRKGDGGLIIDVGANTGFYTLLALSVSTAVTVACYEPLDSVRSILLENLRLNDLHRRASVLPYAASDVTAPRMLYVPDDSHGLVETSASLGVSFKPGSTPGREVEAFALDDRHAGQPRVSVIKVDAEGHDLQVLRGAAGILCRDRPCVFLEVLLGSDEAGLTELLRETGYVDCVLMPDGPMIRDDSVVHHTLAWNHMWCPREADHL